MSLHTSHVSLVRAHPCQCRGSRASRTSRPGWTSGTAQHRHTGSAVGMLLFDDQTRIVHYSMQRHTHANAMAGRRQEDQGGGLISKTAQCLSTGSAGACTRPC